MEKATPDINPIEPGLRTAIEHWRAGRAADAESIYRQLLLAQPNVAERHYDLAIVLAARGDYESAITSYRRAIELWGDFQQAHNNLGNALAAIGENDRAIESYRRAIDLNADDAVAHNNLGIALLRRGDFAGGWREHEWRWKTPGFADATRRMTQPRWDGSDLRGARFYCTPSRDWAMRFSLRDLLQASQRAAEMFCLRLRRL